MIRRKRVRSAELTTIAGGALPTSYVHDYATLSPEGIPNVAAPRSYERILYDWHQVEEQMMVHESAYQGYLGMSKDRSLPRAERNEWREEAYRQGDAWQDLNADQGLNEMQLYLQGRPIPTRAEEYFTPDRYEPASPGGNELEPDGVIDGTGDQYFYTTQNEDRSTGQSVAAANDYMYDTTNGEQGSYGDAYVDYSSAAQSGSAQTADAAPYVDDWMGSDYVQNEEIYAGGDGAFETV
jgi:hypothetical protein